MTFCRGLDRRAGLHAHPYSSKLPALTGEFTQQIGHPLADQRRRGAACCDQFEFLRSDGGDAHMKSQCRRERSLQVLLQVELALPASLQFDQRRFGVEDLP